MQAASVYYHSHRYLGQHHLLSPEPLDDKDCLLLSISLFYEGDIVYLYVIAP
jgi:hypothetical protein